MRVVSSEEFRTPSDVEDLPVDPGTAAVLTLRRTQSRAQHGAPGRTRWPPLWLAGEIDLVTSVDLRAHLQVALSDRSTGPVVLNLSRVSFMDLSGLRMLLEIQAELLRVGRLLLLRSPSAPVLLVVEAAGAGSLFTIEDGTSSTTPDDALDAEPDPLSTQPPAS